MRIVRGEFRHHHLGCLYVDNSASFLAILAKPWVTISALDTRFDGNDRSAVEKIG